MANEFSFKDNKDIARLEDMFNQFFNNKLNRMFPIGALVLTMNNKRPNEIGYPGSWQLYSQGRTLVGRATSGDWDVPVETTGGNDGNMHNHLIFSEEDIPEGARQWIRSYDERQVFSDLLPANSPNVNQEASRIASNNEQVVRFMLHADTSHWEYSSDPSTYVDPQYGKLELRPSWINTVLNGSDRVYPMSENRLCATMVGEGNLLDAAMPPYMVTNIWKRVS